MVRDLEKDLAICETATRGPWKVNKVWDEHDDVKIVRIIGSNGLIVATMSWYSPNADAQFIAEARTGWPETIRYALKLEDEIDRLREENAILLEQLNQRGCGF